ncbi:MAG: FHA domain-containing protein, partial [Verrucomicrobiae bacterium]|nr:FHA domain-containing protein [Verrucomicrobiae bacterium]
MAKRYNLILTLPEGDPVCHQLTSAKVSFGRGEDNRIRVGVKAISSRHCEFRAVGDGYEVIDLGSTNGTKVNGTRVNGLPVRLKNGDQILFGETVGGHFF